MENYCSALIFAIFLMLIFAHLGRWVAYKFYIPMVSGEILAGIFLGPTIFNLIDLNKKTIIFNKFDNLSDIFDFLIHLSLIFLVFISGLKVSFDSVLKYKKQTIYVSLFSGLVPFIAGVLVANQYNWLFNIPMETQCGFSLFFGLALSISALPVIYKILSENDLVDTSSGIIIMSSAAIIDVVCWIVFGIILRKGTFLTAILSILGCSLFITSLFKGKILLSNLIRILEGVLFGKEIILSLCLYIVFGFTVVSEFLGLHSTLGAFLAGVMINSCLNDSELKGILHHFILSFFAPFFFVSIGLKINFLENFDGNLSFMILILAISSKLFGAFLGTYCSQIRGKDSLIIGFALNARGLMEIVISTIALEAGLISPSVYVSLVLMAVFTSSLSGTVVRLITSCKNYKKISLHNKHKNNE